MLQAGEVFRKWQTKNLICYFPTQKKLTYFQSYSQDNCLLECRVKKITKRCGCAPWFIPRRKFQGQTSEVDLPICEAEGDKCFENKSKAYNEDINDRISCDCKNDCEMVHSFSSLQVCMTYMFRNQTHLINFITSEDL